MSATKKKTTGTPESRHKTLMTKVAAGFEGIAKSANSIMAVLPELTNRAIKAQGELAAARSMKEECILPANEADAEVAAKEKLVSKTLADLDAARSKLEELRVAAAQQQAAQEYLESLKKRIAK